MKEKAIEFIVDSDKTETVRSFLWALNVNASTRVSKFVDNIVATQDFSELVAFYNLYHKSLLNICFSTIDQQVANMLREIAPAAAQAEKDKKPAPRPIPGASNIIGANDKRIDMVVSVKWKGQDMLAEVVKQTFPEVTEAYYKFNCWITPDMAKNAAKLVKETVSEEVFKGQTVPEPNREEGDRIVTIGDYPGLAIVTVRRDKLSFKAWVRAVDLDGAQARGQMQNGGIDKVTEQEVAHFVKPPPTEADSEDTQASSLGSVTNYFTWILKVRSYLRPNTDGLVPNIIV